MTFLFLLVLSPASFAAESATIPRIVNLEAMARPLKVSSFKNKKFAKTIKVAILDNGFNSYEKALGVSLPRGTKYHPGKESPADGISANSYHGLLMAQIFAQLIEKSGALADYELHLFNTFGYTKFADAVEKVIEGKFDLVLYSQVWEYGGNGDGKGFINALVNKAVAAGIVWVNAAGNFGRSTRIAKIDGKLEGRDEFVFFSGKDSKGVKISCAPPKGTAKCPLRLVLSWNDFKEDAVTGTDKDLDLILTDNSDVRLAAGVKEQRLLEDKSIKNSSLFPREVIDADIEPGTYFARVKLISKNFSASQDQLRVTASGTGVKMTAPTLGETLLPPADNAGVIVVGASDDQESSASKKWGKPDVRLQSAVQLKDGSSPRSSSTAAAMAAAVVALEIGTSEAEKTTEKVIEKLKKITQKVSQKVAASPAAAEPAPKAASTPVVKPPVRARPLGPAVRSTTKSAEPRESRNCLPRRSISSTNDYVRRMLSERGTVGVLHRGRTAILVDYDFPKRFNIVVRPGQRVFAGPDQMVVTRSRTQGQDLPVNHYEIVYTGWGYKACDG